MTFITRFTIATQYTSNETIYCMILHFIFSSWECHYSLITTLFPYKTQAPRVTLLVCVIELLLLWTSIFFSFIRNSVQNCYSVTCMCVVPKLNGILLNDWHYDLEKSEDRSVRHLASFIKSQKVHKTYAFIVLVYNSSLRTSKT